MEMILGALGVVLAHLLFGAGIFLGARLSERLRGVKKPLTPEEAERRRMVEDQNAFRCVMNYNADVAYGAVSAKDLMGEEGDR